MEIEYEVSMDDIMEFYIIYSKQSPHVQRTITIIRYGGAFFIALIPILLFYPRTYQANVSIFLTWLPMIPTLLVACWWVISYPRKYWRNLGKNLKRIYNESFMKDAIGKHRLTITGNDLIRKTEFSETKIQWNAIEKIMESDNHIFMCLGATNAYTIPKRAIPDETQCREFIETAKRYHADAAREK